MHRYLKAIGLGKIKNEEEIESIISAIVKKSRKKRRCRRSDGSAYVEYICEYSDSCGLIVRGEEDSEGNFHYNHYFPYGKAHKECLEKDIYINKRVDTDAYTGMCEDYRLGISLIFYIQNSVSYHRDFKNAKCISGKGVRLAALAESGKIILPTKSGIEHEETLKQDRTYRSKLIAEANKGNAAAVDYLRLDEFENYAIVLERIKKEDVLSIVQTSFYPYGSESDQFGITANILEINYEENKLTKEKIVILTCCCNGLVFNVYINKENLMGEPMVGRRFRGIIWMQGELVSDTDD